MDWEKVRFEFENSDCTMKGLAEKYGVSLGAVRYRADRYGWKRSCESGKKERAKKLSKRDVIISVADRLLECVAKAADELDVYTMKNKVKTKSVEYDAESGKTGREVICENEQIESAKGIIDRMELKQLVTALKDIKEIYDNQSLGENKVEQLIRGLMEENDEGVQ